MPGSNANHFFAVDDVFANYTIVQFCGSGAYGEVYLAEDISHKTVALKIIPILSGSDVWRMELIGLRHYRQAIENHKGLIEVLHVGETENFFYYTMEAADNMLHGDSDEYIADTLSHRLERGGRLEPEKVLELANTLLDALEYLAEHDLAHRDIKPANIVFVNGQAKLSDIGLISTTGVRSKVVGTLDFLPPEIADGDPVGYGHDLYALGKVLYCALTGLLPENYPEVPLTVPLRAWRQFKNVLLKACSSDPRQRFYTPAEFRAALPASIKPTTWVDEAMESLRSYRKQHPIAWRLGWSMTWLTLAALLLSSYMSINQRREIRNAYQNKISFIFRTIDLLNDHDLSLQRIAEKSGNTARSRQLQVLAELASSARADGKLDATERYCQYADAALRLWSEDEFKQLRSSHPAKPLPESTAKLLNLLEMYKNFCETPLVDYLMESSARELRVIIADIQTRLAEQWSGPQPGEAWALNNDPFLEFSYIPAGRLNGEPRQSFWIGRNEITCATIRQLLPDNGLDIAQEDDLPATNLTWNDRLDVCRIITEREQKAGTLPEGFIYRLPYASEWQFVLHGAWKSAGNFLYDQQSVADFAWFGGNSMYQLQPVRGLSKGTLDVYDIVGNAAESVLLRDAVPGKMPPVGNFGGSFRDRRVSNVLNFRCDIDMLENKWSGLRIVLGRGSIDYFDRNWYSQYHYVIKDSGYTYELLGGLHSQWDGKSAFEWCRLLGGEPAILSDKNLRKKLFNTSIRVRELPSLTGAYMHNGVWKWLDNTPVSGNEWLSNSANGQDNRKYRHYLVWDHGFWRGVNAAEPIPVMIIKYKDSRKILTESPLILKKMRINNKNYWLLRAPVDWYTARRLAELLGGKLAVLRTPAEQAAAIEQLSKFKNMRIALGCYRKNGKWQWLDGMPGPEELPPDKLNRNVTLNRCFMALYKNKLCNSPEFNAFLCEFE